MSLPDKTPEGYVRVRCPVTVGKDGHWYPYDDSDGSAFSQGGMTYMLVADVPIPRGRLEIEAGSVELRTRE